MEETQADDFERVDVSGQRARENPIAATRKEWSATDSLPEPRNWKPERGFFSTFQVRKKSYDFCGKPTRPSCTHTIIQPVKDIFSSIAPMSRYIGFKWADNIAIFFQLRNVMILPANAGN